MTTASPFCESGALNFYNVNRTLYYTSVFTINGRQTEKNRKTEFEKQKNVYNIKT